MNQDQIKRFLMHKHIKKPIVEAANSPEFDVPAAIQELQQKTMEQIEQETALKWAARACAAYDLAMRAPDQASRILRFAQGDEFSVEAREHASEADDTGKLLRYVVQQIVPAREISFKVVIKVDD